MKFSVRIVVCDYYMAKPIPGIDVNYSEFRGADIKQVPVLRIFGPMSDGYKTCLHVHGVFPYFYIPCGSPNPQPQFLYQVAASLDKALNIALKQTNSSSQHVYKITLVKGLPFYGFHYKEHLYLKIFLFNPGLIKQAVELCSNGALLGQMFQPHESHLNFTLQFFIDFNLFGMSNIDLHSLKFRKKSNLQDSNEILLNQEYFNVKAESICYYEADCLASDIINRLRIGRGDGIENPGLEEVWKQEKETRKNLNMSLARRSLSQGRQGEETESHYKFQEMFFLKMSNLAEKTKKLIHENTLDSTTYPAESVDSSELFDAAEVSVHQPNLTLEKNYNETVRTEFLDATLLDESETTIVNEDIALNSSIHYSQVILDSDDLEFLEELKDMEENAVDSDSILGTQTSTEKNDDIDLEYSQVFQDKTLECEGDSSEELKKWDDTFWEDVNIPQLDGTYDDEHTKKVRKRKARRFKLGLSHPKTKKTVVYETDDTNNMKVEHEKIESISEVLQSDMAKKEGNKIFAVNNCIIDKSENDCKNEHIPHTELAVSELYDMEQKFVPLPGPSHVNFVKPKNVQNYSDNLSFDSSPEDKNDLGILSFYNTSKVFDVSSECNKETKENSSNKIQASHVDETSWDRDIKNMSAVNSKKIVVLTPKYRPPSNNHIKANLSHFNIPEVQNQQPYFSNYKDVGDKVEIGQMIIKLSSNIAESIKPFDKLLNDRTIEEWRKHLFLKDNAFPEDVTNEKTIKTLLAGNEQCMLEPISKPPTTKEIKQWINLKNNKKIKDNKRSSNFITDSDDLENSQLIGLSEEVVLHNSITSEEDTDDVNKSLQITMQPDGSYLCHGHSQSNSINDSATVKADLLTLMVLEVHTAVREEINPDPLHDKILGVLFTVTNDCSVEDPLKNSVTEGIFVDQSSQLDMLKRCGVLVKITYVNNEKSLLEKIIETVKNFDPDIMCGYEIEVNSWGYLMERAQALGFDMLSEISRITEKHRQKQWRSDETDYEGKILGRIIFNVWRLLRHELALSSYSFENCMYRVLKERVPKYSYTQLAEWWSHESKILRWLPIEYYLTRLSGTLRMMEKLDMINRTSELARLFGLQWWEVLSRGSQFRVESLMLRAARPLNLVALSPTVKQRAAMRAPECLPLIFEPESRFYVDPMIVLDFQSLYPSMMIAYNYCFSTSIGRVQNMNGEDTYEFGAWRLRIPCSKLEALVKNGQVHWSPVGVGFVKSSVRRGVLPALLRRILAARQAVKKSMKMQTDDSVKRTMHSRQLGLKLIANVTYGYTAANFSGRMPCVEVGDSVVSKGRETLERAIKLVENNNKWNVKVVYGDTDSMFVLVPGRTRQQAFDIGQQIADAVTADNPSPVALKLEKVYQPCILQTKKRYVGYMYESADQETPVYEAKGIETVRRDGCPAGVKMLQQSLCELFESGDMSKVKQLVMVSLARLADGQMPLHELFFTREYNGPNGYRPGAVAPPAEIAKRLALKDRRSVPRTGERVSWLVCAGAPGLPLVRLARTPAELRRDPSLGPFVSYYATRVLLPPLNRCLSLLGADVFKWWREVGVRREMHCGGIARYLWRESCAACGTRSQHSVCVSCVRNPQYAIAIVSTNIHTVTRHVEQANQICASCCGHVHFQKCENTDCPVLWRKEIARQKLNQTREILRLLPAQLKFEYSEDSI